MKQIIQKLFNIFGIEVRKKGSLQRSSLYGALSQLKKWGLYQNQLLI